MAIQVPSCALLFSYSGIPEGKLKGWLLLFVSAIASAASIPFSRTATWRRLGRGWWTEQGVFN